MARSWPWTRTGGRISGGYRSRMHVDKPSRGQIEDTPVHFYVFDLLYADGYDLRGATLRDRKQCLQGDPAAAVGAGALLRPCRRARRRYVRGGASARSRRNSGQAGRQRVHERTLAGLDQDQGGAGNRRRGRRLDGAARGPRRAGRAAVGAFRTEGSGIRGRGRVGVLERDPAGDRAAAAARSKSRNARLSRFRRRKRSHIGRGRSWWRECDTPVGRATGRCGIRYSSGCGTISTRPTAPTRGKPKRRRRPRPPREP